MPRPRIFWNIMLPLSSPAYATAAVIMTVPVIVLFFIGQRYFVRGVMMSGING